MIGYSEALEQIVKWQYELNRTISGLIREVQKGDDITLSLTVLGIAFLYGLIHAAGPGHGKAVIAAYFTRGGRKVSSALKMGYLISIIHTFSALGLTFGLYYIFKAMFRHKFSELSNIAMMASAVMIILVGLYIIYSSWKSHHHDESLHVNSKKDIWVALSIGIVPCPGVMTIVLFCVILKEYMLAIMSAIAMSIGMGLTISLAGVAMVLFSKKAKSFVENKGKWLEVISGFLVLGLGTFLLLGSLKLT